MTQPRVRTIDPVRREIIWSNPLPNVGALNNTQAAARPAAESVTRANVAGDAARRAPDYVAIQRSAAFVELRRRRNRFVVPACIGFFGWYLTYVLLAAYAPAFMAHPLIGKVNVGLVLGFLQFVSTVTITTWYTRYARAAIDPRVDAIRQHAGAPNR